MRRLLLVVLLLIVAAVVGWGYSQRLKWTRQLACYRVGSAATYEAAKQELAWFEQGPDLAARRRVLVSRWNTGNERFDAYLARYVVDADCSEALRKAFSLEFGWRPYLVQRWADLWGQRKENPDEEIASIRRYLEALRQADPPRDITWRDVLNIQAAFCLTGHEKLAHRLTPENWPGRYDQWVAER